MFELQNRIIIVDNEDSQLESLGKAFLKNGLGCKTFNYNDAIQQPLNNVRIAFFDINLTGGRSADLNHESSEDLIKANSAIFNDLATAIKTYIANDNGPYALIFWTSNAKLKDAFILYMQDTKRGHSNTASPFYVDCIDKVNFEHKKDSSELSAKVVELLSNEKIKFLFDFEHKAKLAGEKTINKIYNIIPKDNNWGENTVMFDNLGKVLSKIAADTLGFAHSKENPGKAIFEGLLPILNNEIVNLQSNIQWSDILVPLYAATKDNPIPPLDISIKRNVNSVFHIENTNGFKDVRGVVIEIDKANSRILTCFNISDVNVWFNKLLSIQAKDDRKNEIINNTKLIAIELSAACDYTNRKQRINKYILGAITPIINVEKEVNSKGRIESSYHLGGAEFHFNNMDFQIWLNLNYVFGARFDDQRLGKPLFVFKKEIMDMLGNKYAAHVSRIGITSF